MDLDVDLIHDIKRKILSKYHRFGSEIAVANIEYRKDLKCPTAATDGRNIYIDPDYFASLNEQQRIFLISHEIMHIKFLHMHRLTKKDGEKRDIESWNIATDAIINANLERDGIPIPEGAVNIPGAIKYTAEELYEIIVSEKKNNNSNDMQDYKTNDEEDNNKELSNNSAKENNFKDDHSLWKESESNSSEKSKEIKINEKEEFENNRKEKREKFKAWKNKVKKNILNINEDNRTLKDIGESKKNIDWKLLIRREIDKNQTIWGKRRSVLENNYAYRLEEYDIQDGAETEIMLDISGSVDVDLIKAFLRQIKPLLKESKLKVGCFDDKFWGFKDINNIKDIDSFTVPRKDGGTDLDLPVRSFTKKREINKIIFTDGESDNMPKNDLKKENVVWLVYGNEDFNPCCGKVIKVTEEQIKSKESFKVEDCR